MASKVIKLTESDLKLIVSNILKEQQEKVYSDYDTKYDYKVSKGNWVASKKGENKWFSLSKYPKSIYKLNKKYPNAITTDTKVKPTSKSVSDSGEKKVSKTSEKPSFKNQEEGNSFRKYVNEKFPKIASKYDLDITGKHDNRYIMKVASVNMRINKDLYSFNKGESVRLFDLWIAHLKDDNSLSKFSSGLYSSIFKGDYQPTTGHFVIPFVFPEYEPKIDKGGDSWFTPITRFLTGSSSEDSYGKLGHMGIATVEPNGQVNIFEFGRYSGAEEGYGITKSKNIGKIAKISNGVVNNFESVCTKIKSNSQGEGPSQKMDCRLVPVTDVNKSLSMAKQTTTKEYEAFDGSTSDGDANCGTYTIEIAKAGGVPMGDFCLPNPTGVIKQFNKYSVESVVV